MPLNFEELSRKFNASGVVYPAELINNISKYPERTVITNSVYVEDFLIPGIFFICPESDIKFFKIMKSPPEPGMNFRFLEFKSLSMIEIILYFDFDRQIVLHLNPSTTIVKQFIRECTKQGIISFHFLCAAKNILASSFTSLDEEQMEWAKRNYKRSEKLKSVHHSVFSIVSESQAQVFKSNQRHYSFYNVKDFKSLSLS